MKINFKLLITVLAISISSALFASCSSGNETAVDEGSYAAIQYAPMMEEAEIEMMDSSANYSKSATTTAESLGTDAIQSIEITQPDRKIIKDVYLELETKDYENALSEINIFVERLGGYIQSKSTYGGSNYNGYDYYEKNAYIVAKIPADKLEEFTGEVGELCHVVSSEESAQDVTDRYFDTARRIEVLTAEEDTLLELLVQSTDLNQIIALQSRLSEIRYEIESLEASLRNIDNAVAYSTVSISLNEVVEYEEIEKEPISFAERFAQSFDNGIDNLINLTEDFLLTSVESGPVLLFIALIVFVIYKILKFLSKKINKNRKKSVGTSAKDIASKFESLKDNKSKTEEKSENDIK